MGCGALSQSMPSGRVEGGVSTQRRPSGGHPLYGRLMRKNSSSIEHFLSRGPSSGGFEKGGSGSWAQRTHSLNSLTSARSLSSPSVMPEPPSEEAPLPTDSTEEHFDSNDCVSARRRLEAERTQRAQTDSPRNSPPSPPRSKGTSPLTTSCTAVQGRSQAAPLGALAEPLTPNRGQRAGSFSGAVVELQATAVRPDVAEDWWQAGAGAGDRVRKPLARDESAGRISTDSLGDFQSVDLFPPSITTATSTSRRTTRKGSETEGSVHSACSNSLVSIITTDTLAETDPLHESAASDSLPENTSRSCFSDGLLSDGLEDSTHGSEPPDSAPSWAATSSNIADFSTNTEAASIEDDPICLSFMLERPFAGLETILEEQDDDDETVLKLPRSCSNTSFQVRQSGSKRAVSRGPLGEPASRWPLSSPESPSSELLRTSPCAEGIGTFSDH